MDALTAIILGIIQGISEWLPISSSGHLVLAKYFFGLELTSLSFDVAVHLASLLVVVIYTRKELLRLLVTLLRWKTNTPEFTLLLLVALGTLPIAIIGYTARNHINNAFTQPLLVGIMLLVTGTLLYLTKKTPTIKKHKNITWKDAIIIGTAQVVALLPGISRSGTTISTALLTGIRPQQAVKYSFLLFIPAVLGAGLLEATQLTTHNIAWTPLLIGCLATFITGWASIRLLAKIALNNKLHHFSWYCWALGILTIILVL